MAWTLVLKKADGGVKKDSIIGKFAQFLGFPLPLGHDQNSILELPIQNGFNK